MNKLKAIIFDMDGVLTDTVPIHFRAWRKMFTEEGYDFNFEIYKKKVDGKPRLNGISAVASDVSQEKLLQMADKKQNYFLQLIEEEPPSVFEDALRLLKRLEKEAIKIAVASSSKNTERILKNIHIYDRFQTVVTGNDFKKGKPDPEIFLLAAERLGVDPRSCMVIEDAIEGVNAGINAGMTTVGIARHGNEEELKHAHIIINTLDCISIQQIGRFLKERG